MKCVVLAAGYATRLYPITKNFPKPLLQVKGKTVLDWLLDDLTYNCGIDEIFVVTNHKFASIFQKWADEKKYNISIIDDNTTTNENRLGAVNDLKLAIKSKNINEDLLVIAGDNLLDFSLASFVDFAKQKKASCILAYYENDESKLTKSGVVNFDQTGKVNFMEEKPKKPSSNWVVPPFYYLIKNDINLLDEAINSGCGVDAPGSFIGWLAKNSTLYAKEMPGKRFDIGDIISYNKVKEEYEITK